MLFIFCSLVFILSVCSEFQTIAELNTTDSDSRLQIINESNTTNADLKSPLKSLLPPKFEGRWKGKPTTNAVGPWNESSFYWGFRAGGPTPETQYDWLMENNLDYRGLCDGIDPTCKNEYGWHRYYIEGSGNHTGLTFFCGTAYNLHSTNTHGDTGYGVPLWLNHTTNNSAVFCLVGPKNGGHPSPQGPWPTGCEGCDCFRWDIVHNSTDDTLSFKVLLAPPVVHLEVIFSRDGPAPPLVKMPGHKNFSAQCQWDGRDSRRVAWTKTKTALHQRASSPRPSNCPFRKRANLTSQSNTNLTNAPYVSKFQFCYYLNRRLEYRLEWNFHRIAKSIDVAVSIKMPSPTTGTLYVALGFRGNRQTDPNFFGMNDADIVLGYPGCVRTMYSESYAGAPVDSDYMSVSNASISVDGDRMTLRFSRALSAGHHPIPLFDFKRMHNYMIIWAVGPVDGDISFGCDRSFPTYHSVSGLGTRAFRFIEWDKNQKVMPDFEICH